MVLAVAYSISVNKLSKLPSVVRLGADNRLVAGNHWRSIETTWDGRGVGGARFSLTVARHSLHPMFGSELTSVDFSRYNKLQRKS